MPLAAGEITHKAVIAYAKTQGITLSKPQLVRWHRAGLLPRPRQVPLGRARGTCSAYPEIAAPLAVFLARAKRQSRNLDRMASLAWMAGYPVTPRIRALLIARHEEARQYAAAGLDAFANEDPDNPVDTALNHPLAIGRRRVPRDFRPTFARLAMEVAAGRFNPAEYDRSDFAVLFSSKATRQKSSPFADLPLDWIKRTFRPLDENVALDAIRRLSDAQLEADRDIARNLWARWFASVSAEPPFGMFEAVFIGRRLSPECRWAIRWAKREATARGFASLSAAVQYAKDQHEVEHA